ncbi:Magnetosome protein MamB-g [Candidatus Magnetomoraceae bacterium gMMP-15]
MSRKKTNSFKGDKPELLPECHWCADNVGRIALWGNIGLFAIKILCGIAGNSKALIADAVHSGADVLTATIVLICLHISKAPPDEEHPYGHGATEYIASLFIGISLSSVAVLIVYNSFMDIVNDVSQNPDIIALLGLLISIAGNELMFRQSYCCGIRFGSPAMIANAWENRADVYSSLAALIGVLGSQLGLPMMDSVGAILVAILIFKSAYNMVREAWHGVMDQSLDDMQENLIREQALLNPDVKDVAFLRTRAVGPYYAIDLKIAVQPEITLWKGNKIAEQIKKDLITTLDIDKSVGLIYVSPTGFYERKDENNG